MKKKKGGMENGMGGREVEVEVDAPVSASFVSSLTFLIFSRPDASCRLLAVPLNMACAAKREFSGMPSLY